MCKTWVLKSLASKWRNWKAKLKADHYNPHTTDEERLKDCNIRVLPDQWAALVLHWNSEEVQVCAGYICENLCVVVYILMETPNMILMSFVVALC